MGGKIMTRPGSSSNHSTIHRRKARYGAARRKGAAAAMAGRSTYRDEFQLDHGPDRDESVDGTESERELSVPTPADLLPILLARYSFGECSGSEQALSEAVMAAGD
jgi:hypothetical protein